MPLTLNAPTALGRPPSPETVQWPRYLDAPFTLVSLTCLTPEFSTGQQPAEEFNGMGSIPTGPEFCFI
jgi:hypothetical protein